MNRHILSRTYVRISSALPGGRERNGDNGIEAQPPLRAELFSADQMEQHGRSLAACTR